MTKIIEGINVLEQIPIKEYTNLSQILVWSGIGIAILATFVFFIKTRSQNRICFKDVGTKIFLFCYIFGLGLAIFAVIRFPWFYVETGRYTYKCTFNDSVSANYISENFNVVSVEDNVWTIEDKK